MIRSVRINNFVIVKQLEIELENGLIVLTGETGAGKSVIVGAIDNVFGGKIKPGSLFNDKEPAVIEVTVKLDKKNALLIELLKKYDYEIDEDELFFRKEISTTLRGKIFLNGRRISNQIIKEFREVLLDFHSQRDQQKLFDNNYQLEVIDAYAGLMELRKEFNELYSDTLLKLNLLKELETKEQNEQDRIKLYEFQLNEINNLKLLPGEDEKLQAELNLLQNSQKIIENSLLLEQVIYENDNSVYDIINSFLAKFKNFESDNDHIKNAVNNLESSLVNLDEAVGEIQDLLNFISVDEARQTILEERLNEINSAKQKYKLDIPGLLSYAEKMKNDIENFSSSKEKLVNLKKELFQNRNKLLEIAGQLTKKRQAASRKLETEIKKYIKDLAIPQADVKIDFTKAAESGSEFFSGLNSTGQDEIEILFSANKGIKMQPLKHAASGGELSRFLLTIKKILTNRLENKTIIFDEIDAGIGGKTANLLGEFINDIATYHQILCVTHLAQIAIFASKHYRIVKTENTGKAEIIITGMEQDERKEEIARMLAGSDSELALKYAEEILTEREKIQ
jgi:DNA repair protein RecN (Recombination protein N)